MSRIAARFEALRAAGRKALVPYLTAGDPRPEATVELMHALVEAGADLLELGVPFSDPMADGPVIQAACERALRHGVRLRDVLEMVRRFRARDAETPVVLMGYLNPVEAMGAARLTREAAAAGVDGVLLVDLPPEEAGELDGLLREAGLDLIWLVAPTTSEARLARICEVARGFVYYVSLKGVTGAGGLDLRALDARLGAVRRHTGLPVGVGFGIRDAATAAQVAGLADAVVVGSALVARIAECGEDLEAGRREASAFIRELRKALDDTSDNLAQAAE